MAAYINVQGNTAESYSTQINNVHLSTPYTVDEINRDCLQALRCPDTLVVKNRLKEKDKLLYESIEWIFQDPQYTAWQDGDDLGLLWIKGGAGKGKTMMSIGLIERIPSRHNGITIMTYFFCQNSDHQLNKIVSIIKGLILRLVTQQEQLIASLRSRWNKAQKRFDKDVNSWRVLWDIFLEMLESCQCQRIYVIVDALDECEDEGTADFLRLIVRTGLHQPFRIKWLLTSRPLDSGEQELLVGADQALVSLELNSEHIAKAVKTYIAYKTAELSRRQRYGLKLLEKVKDELKRRAEDTYLWVSLACKTLESVHRDQALEMIQELPPGLPAFYRRILDQLCCGESEIVEGCLRLLKVMMLAYRPLDILEIRGVAGFFDPEVAVEVLIDRCASLIQIRGTRVEFVHESARDHLAGKGEHSHLEFYEQYGHSDVTLNCLTCLQNTLKINLVDLPRPSYALVRPDSSRESVKELTDVKKDGVLAGIGYAATFWVHHLKLVESAPCIQNALTEQGMISDFFYTKFLEWLECLSLLDQLAGAFTALEVLSKVADSSKQPVLSVLIQDATRFLLRHFQLIATWPLQIYSSAMVFTPLSSVTRMINLDRIPQWLKMFTSEAGGWASLVQTLRYEWDHVNVLAFSPDGTSIAVVAHDQVQVWSATTGNQEKVLNGHRAGVKVVAFSPDGRRMASGDCDSIINVWDAVTGDLERTIKGHWGPVSAVAFSSDGKWIASASNNRINVWERNTGDLKRTLKGHTGSINAVAFSPDGERIAAGSSDHINKVWNAVTGKLERTLTGQLGPINAVVFSPPEGKRIASGSSDTSVMVWDAITGSLMKRLYGHDGPVVAIVFSTDGKQIVSGSDDHDIVIWDTATGGVLRRFTGHSGSVSAIAFLRDSKNIASGSYDCTVRIWDPAVIEIKITSSRISRRVNDVALSRENKRIASGSDHRTVMVRDAATGSYEISPVYDSNSTQAVAFSPDGTRIISACSNGCIEVRDIATGDLETSIECPREPIRTVAFSSHGKSVNCQITYADYWEPSRIIACSPNGKWIVIGHPTGYIDVRSAATGHSETVIEGHSEPMGTIAFSPDSKRIALGSQSDHPTIRIWDIGESSKASKSINKSWPSRFHLNGWQEIIVPTGVNNVKFSADGQHLLTDHGPTLIRSSFTPKEEDDSELSQLYVNNGWLYYKSMPILLLQLNSEPTCYDAHDDWVTVGFTNGRVLMFVIDRLRLHSAFQFSQLKSM